MSEQIETKSRTVLDRIHHFHCDGCGKYLGYTTEYDDGYYGSLKRFTLKLYIDCRGWRYLDKNFCDDCREEWLDRLDNEFGKLGFRNKEDTDPPKV